MNIELEMKRLAKELSVDMIKFIQTNLSIKKYDVDFKKFDILNQENISLYNNQDGFTVFFYSNNR